MPGQLTNPSIENYLEPDVVVLTDPRADAQALRETVNIRIPVIALCDTDNTTKNVDLVIPTNNKGRRALSLIFWLFARQVVRERGDIGPTDDLPITIADFEASIRRSSKPVEEF